jgi:hypothetical protein
MRLRPCDCALLLFLSPSLNLAVGTRLAPATASQPAGRAGPSIFHRGDHGRNFYTPPNAAQIDGAAYLAWSSVLGFLFSLVLFVNFLLFLHFLPFCLFFLYNFVPSFFLVLFILYLHFISSLFVKVGIF